jgi:hypothetical protein
MSFGFIYLCGAMSTMLAAGLAIFLVSCKRSYSSYMQYIRFGKVSEFDVLNESLFNEFHPLSIVVDAVLYLFFASIFSAIWPFTAILFAGTALAFGHRKLFLIWKKKDRIVARLKGTNPYGERIHLEDR